MTEKIDDENYTDLYSKAFTGFFVTGMALSTYGSFRFSEFLGWIVLSFWCFVMAVIASISRAIVKDRQKKAKVNVAQNQ